jgi:hypothetical protein
VTDQVPANGDTRKQITWVIAGRWGFIDLLSAIVGTVIYESVAQFQSTIGGSTHGSRPMLIEIGLILSRVVPIILVAFLSGRIIQNQFSTFDKRRWLISMLYAQCLVSGIDFLNSDSRAPSLLTVVYAFAWLLVPISQWLSLRQHLEKCISWVFVPELIGALLASPMFLFFTDSGSLPARPWLVSYGILISPLGGFLNGLFLVFLLNRNGVQLNKPESFVRWLKLT